MKSSLEKKKKKQRVREGERDEGRRTLKEVGNRIVEEGEKDCGEKRTESKFWRNS